MFDWITEVIERSRARRVLRFGGRFWLVAAFVAGAVVVLASPSHWGAISRTILGWDSAVVLWLTAVLAVVRSTVRFPAQTAGRYDVGWIVSLAMMSAAVMASLGAITHLLSGVKSLPIPEKLDHIAASFFTIALSWTALHTLYALHYAHLYFQSGSDGHAGGLAFPETPAPAFGDFLYFSITIGATSQTSDVAITSSRLRRTVTAHAVLSFAFNTGVLALTVNIGAGIL